jgi:hypothetical protein
MVGVLEELGTAIETLDIPLDGDALTAAIALRDRLDARISDTIAAYDTAALWELEGATSMTGWLPIGVAWPAPGPPPPPPGPANSPASP